MNDRRRLRDRRRRRRRARDQLALRRKGHTSIAVIESCPKDAIENASTRNSGVIHAGIYYKRAQRPKKAELCVTGNRLLYEFCEEFSVPHARTGKLVVAATEREVDYLRDVLETANENGVPDVRMLDAEQHRAIEPRIAAVTSLHVPTSGVIDAYAYLKQLQACAGCHDLFSTRVVA
ncbi:MAG TPA: FAD-dependent oxidoreductase, partial [Kofleriaceae bacterium]